MYICIYIHTYIYLFYDCIVHAQDRHIQWRSPRHQLYEVLVMSADSYPRYHLNKVVPSSVLPAICCMTSEAYPWTSPHALFADCEPLCSLLEPDPILHAPPNALLRKTPGTERDFLSLLLNMQLRAADTTRR